MGTVVDVLARGLVDHQEQVEVREEQDGGTLLLALYVAQEDLGQVIGRGGRTARALRTVLRSAAIARGERATLEIVD